MHKTVLAAMFRAVDEYLRETAVSQLGWLLVESWPQSWIRGLGFEQINSVATFVKEGTDIPAIRLGARVCDLDQSRQPILKTW